MVENYRECGRCMTCIFCVLRVSKAFVGIIRLFIDRDSWFSVVGCGCGC